VVALLIYSTSSRTFFVNIPCLLVIYLSGNSYVIINLVPVSHYLLLTCTLLPVSDSFQPLLFITYHMTCSTPSLSPFLPYRLSNVSYILEVPFSCPVYCHIRDNYSLRNANMKKVLAEIGYRAKNGAPWVPK
jgi:hypothetical protein